MSTLVDSQYRFTDPIRFFKANDPIYYEVQNIPLKQLQENDQYLLDQVRSLTDNSDDTITRSRLEELRPYTDGVNNVIKVRPGRFTARVNDAYNLTPLQVLDQVLGDRVADGSEGWLAAGSNETILRPIIDKFKQSLQLDLNGLVERAFTYPALNTARANTTSISSTPKIAYLRSQDQDYGQPPFPQIGMVLWNRFQDLRTPGYPGGLPNPLGEGASNEYAIRQYDEGNIEIGFSRLGSAETAFIKRWRGIARTAVVDVPSELNITIPPFKDVDHFYINEAGEKVYTNATQRIDLLFVYSKPIDVSSTTIPKYVNGVPTTITSPQLGIVYGAGVGVSFKGYTQRINEVLNANGVDKSPYNQTDDTTLPDGTPKMLSHYGDESGSNTGFNLSGITVKGSFPAPDDLMNLSPLLDEELDSSSLFLVGQSILPLAYIVVKKNASINLDGTPVITEDDVIDIRPFLRTTELSYNERAGIAAAVPSLSIANPVVTKAEFLRELRRTYDDILTRIPVIEPQTPTDPTNPQPPQSTSPTPRVVGAGTIYGGYDYGVEASLAAFILKVNPGLSKDQVKLLLKQNYGYGVNANIPDQPSWEIAKWVQSRSSLLEPGNFPNDRIHISTMTPTEFGCYADRNKTRRIKIPGVGGYEANDAVPNPNVVFPQQDILTNTVFVKKTIILDRAQVPWMSDYNVNVQFLNCVPLAGNKMFNSPTGIWIDKRVDRFTIFVAWSGRETFPGNLRGNGSVWNGKQPTLNNNESYFQTSTWLREGNDFAGFIVMNKDLCDYQTALSTNSTISNTNSIGQNSSGVCIYPTVRFEVVGLPTGFYADNSDFTEFEPSLSLS